MKAMILDENLNFAWREVPDPVRKPGEILIEVHAAAVNRADLMQKDGKYASPPDWPQWCGLEVAGVVRESAEDGEIPVGTPVCALLGGGGYSELVTAPAGMVLPLPEGLSMIEGASIPEVWSTAYLNLEIEAGGLRRGDVFYVQAGASGVGLAAIQLAKLRGATVITTVGSAEKAEVVRKFGADFALNYRVDDVGDFLAKNPPNVVLDCVGGKNMGEVFRNMAFGGRWIMIATLGGAETVVNLETVWRKRLRLIGSTLRSRTSEEKTSILQALRRELWASFSAREIITNIHKIFPIAEVESAHAVLRRSENIGKVVLQLR